MLDYTLKRQLIVAVVFFAIIAAVIGAWYMFMAPKATCLDGILNQNEEKIDCGGPCAPCAVIRYSDIEVVTYHSFSIGGVYDAMAQVRNPNPQHGMNSFSYTFHFFDAQKKEIGARAGQTYILAGQTRYVVENNITLKEAPVFVTFSVDETGPWEEQQRLTNQVSLTVFSKKYEKVSPLEQGFAKVSGVLKNDVTHTFGLVDVRVVLVDDAKNPIAVGKTQVDNVRAGEQRAFVVLFPKEILLPADIYAEATTNVLNAANVR